jgi:DnaK suppressor protein
VGRWRTRAARLTTDASPPAAWVSSPRRRTVRWRADGHPLTVPDGSGRRTVGGVDADQVPTEHAALVRQLAARREELAAELARLTAPPDEAAVVAFGKRVGDGTTEAVERISSTLTARSIASSLGEVDRALEKVEAGTFGVCDVCGDRIPVERLEARPFTSRCIRHAT